MTAGKRVQIAGVGILIAALAGCGGGGGGSDSDGGGGAGGGGGGNNNPPPPPPPPPTFTVGGTVSGLTGSVVLQNNGGGDLTVSANGTFAFVGSLNSGASYNVTVQTQPELQACSAASGSGALSANVTDVTITCADTPPTLALTLQKTKLFRFAWNSTAGSTHYRLRVDPTGSSEFAQLGADIPASTTSFEEVVTLYRRLGASYVVQACSAARCIDSNTVSVTGSLAEAIGYFKASNPHLRGEFGSAVALSADGKTLAVGAPGERSLARVIDGAQTDAGIEDAGAVYVFALTGNEWAQQAYVKAGNTDAGDRFGSSLALSADGSILAVGAELEDGGIAGIDGDQLNEGQADSGAVYIFSRTGVTWSRRNYIKASNTQTTDVFGASLALSADGRALAVGAPNEDSSFTGVNSGHEGEIDDGALNSGAAYVFLRSGDTWIQHAYVKAPDSAQHDAFGISVALSGDGRTLAVGASSEDSGATGVGGNRGGVGAPNSGAVYVYRRQQDTWLEQEYIKATNTGRDDQFGIALALSANGNTLAVGAIGEDSDADSINNSGAVYVYRRASNVWAPGGAYLKASNAGARDSFGFSVALSADGQMLVAGARSELSSAKGIGGDEGLDNGIFVGAAYAFTLSGDSWTQRAYIKASNAAKGSNEQFGQALALSGDGAVLAVGAVGEDGETPGVNGDETQVSASFPGAVYLY